MTNEEKFKSLKIPEEYWDLCYVTDKGEVFAPYVLDGKVIQTGEEACKFYLKQIDICQKDNVKSNEELTNENKILNEAVTELTELVSMLMA